MSSFRLDNVKRQGIRQLLNRLAVIQSRFAKDTEIEKRALLHELDHRAIRDPHLLIRLHKSLCYLRAFPGSPAVARIACAMLNSFGQRIQAVPRARRTALNDTGISETSVCHEYSYEQALWLANLYPECADIAWDHYDAPETLDDLLSHLLTPAEEDIYFSGEVTTRQWVERAKGDVTLTDLKWLQIQLNERPRFLRIWRDLYESAEVPIRWKLDGAAASITSNALARNHIRFRVRGMRKPPRSLASAIIQPLRGIRLLDQREGRQVVDAAMHALAVRQRDVYSMTYANAREVYLVPLGEAVEAAVLGVRREYRPILEGNFGYLLLSNGVPIGYGGVSPLFHQANTGLNIFEEYRRSEAAFLFAQLLRVFHNLFGSRRFIIDPYQFGRNNPEALHTGAFWFYYRLGFRPDSQATRILAQKEWQRLKKQPGAKSDRSLLRTLSRSTMAYHVPGFRTNEGFDESWLTLCSDGATRVLADQRCTSRSKAARRVTSTVRATIGVSALSGWTREEREAFQRMSPIVQLGDLSTWSKKDKSDLVSLMRAQGGTNSRAYIVKLCAHERFRMSLTAYCQAKAKAID